MFLNNIQIDEYKKKGFLYPIDIFSYDEIQSIKNEINIIEKNHPNEIKGSNRNNIHYYSKVFDNVVHHYKILDIVESLIGKNILAAGTCLFLKEPDKKKFISWHQDGKYQGWKPLNFLTAWVAITDVTIENGCMRMWSGSHKKNFFEHEDTFDKNNLLTRGQTINSVPKEKTEPILLKAGQMSIHHPMTVHGSGPNISNERRIGFAIQSYIGTNVKQYEGKTIVQLARGEDKFNFYEHASRVKNFMNKESLRLRDLANEELKKILYKDSQKTRNY